eukprot:TRINITY_DN2131_c0_g1_i1.p3 TRINITY_DN2131_c0_g1~~TRINITY_DN2131_c0_g1_i1.p3  ORF type:complete len:100 (-),score=31.43 TRINITY_DN2131_c0_g1_i1:846-1145(-)
MAHALIAGSYLQEVREACKCFGVDRGALLPRLCDVLPSQTAINAVVHLAECYIPGHTEFGAQQVRETIREDTAAALRSLQQRMNHTGVLRSLQQRMKQT